MIVNFLILVISSIAFLGYSILLKKFVFYSKHNYQQIYDYDIFFGFILVFILAFLFNIILPLIYFTEIFFLIGILLFIYFKNKIIIDFNIKFYFVILLALVFITYNTQTVYDTNLYHLQILNWNSFYKLNFGLSNLELRFGTNSFWQLILSIFNNPKYNVQYLYLVNCIPIAILINQFHIPKEKEIKLSFIYIFCCFNFILLFSIIHSNTNGPIINSLRSPEVDTVAMFFFIFSVYFFLKYFEDLKYSDYVYCFIFSCLAAITKISHIGILLLPISIFLFSKPKISRVLIICLILFFIWLIKSFILSGCWLFPITFTCLPEVIWSTPIKEISLYSKIVSSYPKAHSANVDFMNFDYTLNSLKWFYPWLKTYFFATSFFIIFVFITSISLLFALFRFFINGKKININKVFYFFIIFYLFNLYIWLNAPALRYGYGLFISFSCLIFAYSFQYIIKKFELVRNFKFLPIFFILVLLIQNYKNINYINDINIIKFDNSNIKLFKNIDGIDFYKSDVNHGFCNDFKLPCIIYPSDFKNKKYLGYNFFYRNKNQ